jgi:hypothetical protein
LAVPKTLAEKGYDPKVAARQLQDKIDGLLRPGEQALVAPLGREADDSTGHEAKPEQMPDIGMESDLSKKVVPGFGISLEALAVSIQAYLGLEHRHVIISGEFTIHGGQLWLVLRKDHHDPLFEEKADNPTDPDKLLVQAAFAALKVFDKTNPSLGAKLHYDVAITEDN